LQRGKRQGQQEEPTVNNRRFPEKNDGAGGVNPGKESKRAGGPQGSTYMPGYKNTFDVYLRICVHVENGGFLCKNGKRDPCEGVVQEHLRKKGTRTVQGERRTKERTTWVGQPGRERAGRAEGKKQTTTGGKGRNDGETALPKNKFYRKIPGLGGQENVFRQWGGSNSTRGKKHGTENPIPHCRNMDRKKKTKQRKRRNRGNKKKKVENEQAL